MSNAKDARKRGLGRALRDVAPSLANALGGPLAGAAVEAVSRAIFGPRPEGPASAREIEEALTRMGPEEWLALRRAELDFAAALEAARVETLRIAATDRADARARQVALKDRTPMVIGGLIIFGFFATLAFMVARRLPEGAETEFSIMLGALATMTAAVVNYFFGSSAGSKEKTRAILSVGAPKD